MYRLLKAGQKVEMEADIKTAFFNQDPQGYNVIAEIPGTDKKLKDEVVTMTPGMQVQVQQTMPLAPQ
jgi:carboxypeptidase Q